MHPQGIKRYRDVGGHPMVLLFGDDFQLVSVSNNGAINEYVKRSVGVE